MGRKASKTLTLRKGADGYYRCSWTDANGKPHQRSFGNSAAAARNRFADFYYRWKRYPTVRTPSQALTINEAVADFERWAAAYYRRADGVATNTTQVIKYACKFLTAAAGDMPVAEMTPSLFKQIQADMVEAELRTTTVADYCAKIRQLFRWLVESERVEAGVWMALRSVPAVKAGRTIERGGDLLTPKRPDPIHPVPQATLDATVAKLPPTLRAMVEFQLWTACRPQEVCMLTPGQIDTSAAVWVYRPVHHKSAHHGYERVVLIGPQAQATIRPFLRVAISEPLFSPHTATDERLAERRAKYEPDSGVDYRHWDSYIRRLMEMQQRRAAMKRLPYKSCNYRQAIQRACDAAAVPRWSPNQLRHNAATKIREAYGIEVAAIILGHQDANVTQVYAEADINRAKDVIARIG